MPKSFEEKVENFIRINPFYVGRVHTMHEWFSLQDAITVDVNQLDSLVIPTGLELEIHDMDEYSESKCYFIVDTETGVYEELIDKTVFWQIYAESLKMMKIMDEICSPLST